jgi:hypothetical protein
MGQRKPSVQFKINEIKALSHRARLQPSRGLKFCPRGEQARFSLGLAFLRHGLSLYRQTAASYPFAEITQRNSFMETTPKLRVLYVLVQSRTGNLRRTRPRFNRALKGGF